jgi:citrate lyase acyl carrier protein
MAAAKQKNRAAGEAGRRGEKIRSDLWVSVEPDDAGGIRVELRSRVEPYYGDSIREQAVSTLTALGLPHARVEIEDSGALPFVIGARLEAAALRCGIEPAGDARPAPLVDTPAP